MEATREDLANLASEENEEKRVYAACRGCALNCPVWVTVRNGRAVAVEGDPELGPPNMGRVCERGFTTYQRTYSPTRIRYPMKRMGKRGEGKWKRLSWDEAVSEIAAKTHELVEKYGAETFVLPGRTNRGDMGWIAHRIARTIGTPNNYYGPIQVCCLPNFHETVQLGSFHMSAIGMQPTGLYMTFGQETSVCSPVVMSAINDNLANGMKMVVVDPVYSHLASMADEWVPVRPGTDLAFVMAIIRYLLKNNLFDADFVMRWTNGPFLVRSDTGALLTEADVVKRGNPKRYMFRDEATGTLKWWDADEVQWEGGASGRDHYEHLEELNREGKVDATPSPAVLPEEVKPALFGTYDVTLASGVTVACKPVMQALDEAMEAMTPQRAEEITGVPADQIERIAQMVGTIHPADIYSGGQYMATNNSQYLLAITVLNLITGNVEAAGGAMMNQFYPVTPQAFPSESDLAFCDGLPLEMKRKRLGYYEHRIGCGYAWEEVATWQPLRPSNADSQLLFTDLSCVMKAIETGVPYEVHGMYSISSNWLMHDPTTARWLKIMADESKIQLHVCTDINMTPTAELADYVLPGLTWLERSHLLIGGAWETPMKQCFDRAVEPVCEAKSDYDFGAMLSRELGKYNERYVRGVLNSENSKYFAGEVGEFWPAPTLDEYRDQLCQRFGGMSYRQAIDMRMLPLPQDFAQPFGRQIIAGKFPTDTGKANIFSTVHQKCGYPALPTWSEPAESPVSRPDLAEEYPLRLTTGRRQQGFYHSEYRESPWAREMVPGPDVFVNPDTAASFGVKEGDWVWVEAPPTGGRAPHNRIMGRVSFRLMVRPDVVCYAQHGWWRPEKGVEDDLHGALEWNVENLIELDHVSPETGTGGLRSQLCKIYPASPEDIEKYHPDITLEELYALMPSEEVC